MASKIFACIFMVSLYLCIQAKNCNDNPCQLGNYFVPAYGYQCIQEGSVAKCTCPSNPKIPYVLDAPCRICDPKNSPCAPSAYQLMCLETNQYGKAYACLCNSPSGPLVTATDFCDVIIPVTLSTISVINTTPSTPVVPLQCYNGGNLVSGICHCPSGFTGTSCQDKDSSKLCDGMNCQNNGVCATRSPQGVLKPVCLCPYGTFGEYCHLIGALTTCNAIVGFCLNGGTCEDSLIGITRHAYCNCPLGYNGIRCENRYFKCDYLGLYEDSFMSLQGKYFQCTPSSGSNSYVLERKSCPTGLQFDITKYTCVKI